MKILLFGATGMIGQGTLRACLEDPAVTQVVSLVRSPTGQRHDKLREVPVSDFSVLDAHAAEFDDIDACLFCLGVSASGMSEADYRRITYDYTLAAARVLHSRSPEARFLYVSGAGTDSTERGRWMWARVKGETENALLALSPRAVMLRPGYIQPVGGIVSKTPSYRLMYGVMGPLFPLLKWLAPRQVITTEELGRAMVAIAAKGADKRVLEAADLIAIGRQGA